MHNLLTDIVYEVLGLSLNASLGKLQRRQSWLIYFFVQ